MKLKTLFLACALLVALASNSIAATTTYSGSVNLNTASEKQLVLLPGIGPAKARAILEQRKKKPFAKLEELLLISGIGESLFLKIKPFIALKGETTLVKQKKQ